MPVSVFTTDVQRRVRLRNSKRFDLDAFLGEPLAIHIGEMPQSQQAQVVAFLNMRQELLAHSAAKAAGEQVEMGAELSKKLLTAMQDLIAGALLDERGDRLSADDARALFDLLPASIEVAALLHEMSEAVLARLGGKKADTTSAASDQPPPK